MAASRTEQTSAAAADCEARRAIAEDLGTTLLVEAAAGTGKTTSLVTRMVALVREGRATVEHLSAVTFTVKAARQLAQRFQERLERELAGEKDPTARARLEAALAQRSAAFLGTIHAFCARLLKERPVEAGVEPGFTGMEESEDRAARREAWERYVQKLFVEESEVLPRLTELGVALEDLRETYDLLCENADVPAATAPERPMPDLAPAAEALRPLLERVRLEMPAETPADGWDSFGRALREATRLDSVLDPDHPADAARVLDAFTRIKRPTPKTWRERQKDALLLWHDCDRLRREIVEPALTAWREFLHPIVIGILTPAVGEYASWRRREGKLNFQDLLGLARDLLRDHPAVRRTFRERFTPLLVDEFQDTDPIQAEVLLYLTGSDVNEADWRRLSPVPGSLFVVGDPKQSIYRFRRADIETYGIVREIVARSGGRVVTLTRNFRSTPAICAWINRVFTRVFPSESTEKQAAYVPLVPADPSDATGRVFRLDIATSGRTRDGEAARLDAERVGEAIARMVGSQKGGAAPGDVLVMTRRRVHLPLYARALENRGIPYEISGGGAFRTSEEIRAFLPLLRSIVDPDDPVSLVAVLRGPLFGVDDAALYRHRCGGGRWTWRADLGDDADPRLRRAWELLRQARRYADELPPGAAVSRILETFGWTALAAARELGETRAGNLLKAATAARVYAERGEDLSSIVDNLAAIARSRDDDTEEMSTAPGRRDAVQLMTLHRAKGLQARIVFLADPTGESPPTPAACIERRDPPPRAHFLVRRRMGENRYLEIARPMNWDEKLARELEFDRAEQDRLLYVAATRAAETVVVSFRRQQNASGEVSFRGPWARLHPEIADELPVAAAPEAPSRGPALLDAARDLARFRAERSDPRTASSHPGYAAGSVTGLSHAAERPFRIATGRGLSWGSVLHRVLEAAMRDRELDLSAFAANVLAEEERPASDLGKVLEVVEAVRSSPIWKRALAAKRCLVEVPFALTVASEELGIRGGPDRTVLQGAIDLVFEEERGWTLVDYKSDTVDGNLDELVRFYTPQIAHYRRVWARVTGRPTRAGLYFIRTGMEVWLPQEDVGGGT